MTYDENEDYNGPDSTRRGPFLFMAALVGVILVAGFGAAVSDARADPNTVTVLPADGVQSITRDGDLWAVTTYAPASEIKYMGPGAQQIICGINYGNPCATSVTFTATGECAYLQADGIPGHNSSDPYICLGGTPSTPTPPTTTSPAVPSPEPTTSTPATSEPSPSPTPTSSPTSTPEPSSNPTTQPIPEGSESGLTSGQRSPQVKTPLTSQQDERPRLAGTGTTDKLGFTLLMGLMTLLGVGVLLISRRVS